jgi:hypothetical protein
MTNLMIDDLEADLLRQVINAHLIGLRVEIAHADSRDFRANLQRRHEVLENLLRRVPVDVAETPPPHTPPIL